MRCLYCGKPLPLLKKLTGGGEFCSEAHRHKYQEEYNKLALSRLLQAQSAPGEVGVFPAGGGSGLRQLAAPAPAAQPITGQRALPPPSTPSLPPVEQHPPTAHHQEAKSVPAPQPTPAPSTYRVAASPAPPPVPDPKEAPFLISQHEPIGPAVNADILSNLSFSFEAVRPLIVGADSEAIPFDWAAVASTVAASQEPDPPEAPAWVHPIPFQAPGEGIPANLAAFPVELFASKLAFPQQPDVSFRIKFPQVVRPKINLPIERDAVRVIPGELRFSGVRDWELNLQAPEWRPSFVAIGAPPPPPKPVVTLIPPVKALPVAEPVAAPVSKVSPLPSQAPPPSSGNVEVFVDLSALGIFE